MKTLEQHFTDWESDLFGYGYGTGEDHTVPAVRAFLLACTRDGRGYDYEELERALGSVVAWLLINTFCKADVIEYGTSPRYGWLTRQGLALREFVRQRTSEELIELTSPEDRYCYCYRGVCNCGPTGFEKGRKCGNPFWDER